jgi:hypothetical protein
MAKRKGPTPKRRIHHADAELVTRLQTLDTLVGQRNRELADARRRIDQLERLVEATRDHVSERAFGVHPSPEALRVLRDIGDTIGRRAA